MIRFSVFVSQPAMHGVINLQALHSCTESDKDKIHMILHCVWWAVEFAFIDSLIHARLSVYEWSEHLHKLQVSRSQVESQVI